MNSLICQVMHIFAGFIIFGINGFAMAFRNILLLAVCILVVIVSGCTMVSPATVTPAQTPAPALSPVVPATSLAGDTATGCAEDVCSAIPPSFTQEKSTSLLIEASPYRYSPMMSSTPGIGLVPNATGFNTSAAVFSWNASYGQFLSWDAPDYRVNQLGAIVSNSGGKLYWTFIDTPTSTTDPVIITVNAKDPASGTVLGTSTITLAWDGNNAVTVKAIQ